MIHFRNEALKVNDFFGLTSKLNLKEFDPLIDITFSFNAQIQSASLLFYLLFSLFLS